MKQAGDILVGGIEREMLRMSSWDEQDPRTVARLDQSVRLAILFSPGYALIPASGYFETACGYPVILRFRPNQERGQLVLQGTAGSPEEYVSFKLDQWRGSSAEQKLYGEAAVRRIAALEQHAWRSKTEPTDNLIIVNWSASLENGDHPLLTTLKRTGLSSSHAERIIARLPGELDGTVLLVDNILRHIRKPALALNG
jgi:hypothetical protein